MSYCLPNLFLLCNLIGSHFHDSCLQAINIKNLRQFITLGQNHLTQHVTWVLTLQTKLNIIIMKEANMYKMRTLMKGKFLSTSTKRHLIWMRSILIRGQIKARHVPILANGKSIVWEQRHDKHSRFIIDTFGHQNGMCSRLGDSTQFIIEHLPKVFGWVEDSLSCQLRFDKFY